MNKFIRLVIKELRELLTPQMIIPFAIMIVVFMLLGNFLEDEQESFTDPKDLIILDLDESELSSQIPTLLEQANYEVIVEKEKEPLKLVEEMENDGHNAMIVIPEGFSESVSNSEITQIETYTIIHSFSSLANIGNANVESLVQTLNEVTSNIILTNKLEMEDITPYKYPIEGEHKVIVNGISASVPPSVVYGFISSQITFIPIILFLVITIAAQLVATAIATEKENKTLETLLASPINRKAIVAAKLLAAGLISMLFAGAYLVGMRNLTSSLSGTIDSISMDGINESMAQLGLQFSGSDMFILGIVVFLGIMVALSVAFILGAFAKDSRSAQGVIAPVMMMLLIPYLLSMFMDINQMETIPKTLLYTIPFTHTFTAAPNILLGNYLLLGIGIAYNFIIIIAAIYFASKLFSTELIMTARLPKFLSKS